MRLLLSLLLIFASSPGNACSSLASPLAWEPAFAHNFDWHTVMANLEGGFTKGLRGVEKTGVLLGATPNVAKWTSKYASLSFSVTGPEYPASGINEKGLFMIVQALPETEWPSLPDARPALSTTQFVQYHLDQSTTIEDVIASDAQVIPYSAAFKVHFLVCDATRNCAVIQYLQGKMVSYKGQDLPYLVMTNSLYPVSVTAAENCKSEGECVASDNSLSRFAELAVRSENAKTAEPVATGFWPWLDFVAQLPTTKMTTRFQVVFDPKNKIVYAKHWKTKKVMQFSYDFENANCTKLDGLESPVYLPINAENEGDFTGKFAPLSLEGRKSVIMNAGLPANRADEMVQEALKFRCTK